MNRVVDWIKSNVLVCVLLLIIGFLLLQTQSVGPTFQSNMMAGALPLSGGGITADVSESRSIGIMPPIYQDAPPVDAVNRLVVRDTTLSLLVNAVGKAVEDIEKLAVAFGGYLVNSQLSSPEGAASGSITVRVPSDKRADAVTGFKKLGVKTVSEAVSGRDVTDEYVDLEARLDVLNKTKTKFEAILAQASKIPDLLEVQRELVSLQSQIDSLKGQQKYLEQTAKLTKITVYLSTDELALPYAPDQPWRPNVIFKQAVRSLIGSARELGTMAIWILVYAPVWLPIVLIFFWWKRRK